MGTHRLVVLGSGNAFHENGRAHASYWIDSGVKSRGTLIDCGATTLYRLRSEGISTDEIDAIVLTHFHGDHIAGVPFVLLDMQVMQSRKRPVVVAGPPGTESRVTNLFSLCYPDLALEFELEFVEAIAPFSVGDLRIAPFAVTHRPESTGYRIGIGRRSVAISGDCDFDERLIALVRGSDIAVIELSLRHRSEKLAHVSLDDLIEHGDLLEVGELVVTHTNDELAAEAERLHVATGAFDGMELEIL